MRCRKLHDVIRDVTQIVLLCSVGLPVLLARGPPRIMTSGPHPPEQTFRVGETMRLQCPVESDPSPIVNWEKDGESIHIGWERFTTRNKDLIVRYVDKIDSGQYVCKAVNGFGSVEFTYYVSIYPQQQQQQPAETNSPSEPAPSGEREPIRAPYFEQRRMKQMLKDQTSRIAVGNTVRLRCRAEGSPKPRIYWYRNGLSIPNSYRGVTSLGSASAVPGSPASSWSAAIPDEEDTSAVGPDVLELASLTPEDSGIYTCRAINGQGSVNFTYTLLVTDELPSFAGPLSNITESYNGNAVFHCYVRSPVEPLIQWLKRIDSNLQMNGTIQFSGERYLVLSGSQNGVIKHLQDDLYLSRLTIVNVTEQQVGLYVCSATNTYGYRFQSAYLHVRPAPKGHSESGTSNSYSPMSPIVIAGIVVLIFFAVFILVAIIVARRRRRHRLRGVNNYVMGVANGGTRTISGQKMPPSTTASLMPTSSSPLPPMSPCIRNDVMPPSNAAAGVHMPRCYVGQPYPPSQTSSLLYHGQGLTVGVKSGDPSAVDNNGKMTRLANGGVDYW